LGLLFKSISGPELYRIYKHSGQSIPGRYYQMNIYEYLSSSFITFFNGLCAFCKWSSPVLLAFAYSRGYFSIEGLNTLCHLAFLVGAFLGVSYVSRGYGRLINPDYQTFIERLANTSTDTAEKNKILCEYDFEIRKWTADFKPDVKPNVHQNEKHIYIHNSIGKTIKLNIWRLLSFACVDTFGLRMMYPGVIIKSLIGKALLEGRANFIENKKAQRAVVQTADKYENKIDTLFVDQRTRQVSSPVKYGTIDRLDVSESHKQNGSTLVICCDGNASFYEVGCFSIPIEKGYSTLGWNYPGFGQSTGLPYPDQLTAAADAVMQYAFHLGFKQEDIVLFSWSIGGFACSWLANQYPDTKSVVLDACFDSVIPLAQQQMPKFAINFVEYTIKHQLNLNVGELICKYNGPVMFIRRTQDEIISTMSRHPSSNLGNNLLIRTLITRYPFIINSDTIPYLRTWLSASSRTDRTRILSSYTTDFEKCEELLADYVQIHSADYPLSLGANNVDSEEDNRFVLSADTKLTLAFYLADKYLANFESSHCVQLPKSFFKPPWSDKQLLVKKFSF